MKHVAAFFVGKRNTLCTKSMAGEQESHADRASQLGIRPQPLAIYGEAARDGRYRGGGPRGAKDRRVHSELANCKGRG